MNTVFNLDTLIEVLLAISLSTAAGFRVFVPLLVLSGFAVFGHVDFPANFDWLESNQALLVLAAACLFEITGYYIPWLDHLFDVVATPAAVIAGTVVSASLAPDMSPVVQWTLGLVVGGGAAGLTKGFMNLIRTASTALSGGLTNPVLATLELGVAIALSVLAITLPLVAGTVVIGLFAVAVFKAKQLLTQIRTQNQTQTQNDLSQKIGTG